MRDASFSSFGAVVLTGAARWSSGSCGCRRKPLQVFRTRQRRVRRVYDETDEKFEDETENPSLVGLGCNREDDGAAAGGRSVSGLVVWLFFVTVGVIVIACTADLILATSDAEQ
ncbi:unnamed protein product [Macrosiphum euphorbiae]|uniref:Uncharacterized protein n=1 Tax=Macrosiphum euphorbiae TaxID=13131 RepID=A0AAV0WHD0_9HEMI|nr:unnamed protein product [Macrosiphum euphorbiae]